MQLFGRSLVFALPCRIPHNRLRKDNGRSEMCMFPARRDVCFGGQRFREVVWFVLTHPSGDMPGGVVSGFAGLVDWTQPGPTDAQSYHIHARPVGSIWVRYLPMIKAAVIIENFTSSTTESLLGLWARDTKFVGPSLETPPKLKRK